MRILIVDDSSDSLNLLENILNKAGYSELTLAQSADSAFKELKMDQSEGDPSTIDLILMDILMPGIDGIEACRKIKEKTSLQDIPIVMVTDVKEIKGLESAFEAGAIDYITKPYNKLELLTRVKSVLRLKHEMDRRKEVKRQLEERNRILEGLSFLDVLTGIANRRAFDEFIDREWRRSLREEKPLSLIMVDIDYFKKFNDGYGHQAGDDCLKQVGQALSKNVSRPGDFVARYGGEEFVVVLGNTDAPTASAMAERLRLNVEIMKVPHAMSDVASVVTLSLGVACLTPSSDSSPEKLIKLADEALYRAKEAGRNRVEI